MHRYYLDLAAYVRTFIQNCETIRDLSKVLMNFISEKFNKILLVCDAYLEFSTKNNEKMSRGQGEKFVLFSSGKTIS